LLYRDYKQFIGKRLYDRTAVEAEYVIALIDAVHNIVWTTG